MNKHNIGDLYQMQSLPLKHKITMTIQRVNGWLNHWDDNCYISFSGGKDSTVLVDIIHNKMGRTDIPLVFVDTGLEYPEIREFVKSYGDRVTWLRPKMNFKQVIEKYGYPFISKEVSEAVSSARKYLTRLENQQNALTDRQTDRQTVPYAHFIADILGVERRKKGVELEDYEALKKGIIPSGIENMPCRVQMLFGKMPHKEKGKMTNEYSKRYDKSRYQFFLDAPFEIDNSCCKVMKKEPMHRYAKETGRKPITAQMASESRLRTEKWLQHGCNGFDMKEPISNPMSFWTEQDVLAYIKTNNIKIAPVYGEVIEDCGEDGIDGQMRFDELDPSFGVFDLGVPLLKTTGCNRTGCMFCGYGCHMSEDDRFVRMKETHPKQYEYIMKPWEEGGLNYKEIIDWINKHGNMNIRY